MTPAQIFANPSLMTLVCLLGGAVREGMERNVWLQLMVMGTFVPRLGAAMRGTMIVADQLGCDAPWLHEDDPVDDEGNPCSGWVRQENGGWVWRCMTKALVMIIAMAWAPAAGRRRRQRRVQAEIIRRSQAVPVVLCFLKPDLAYR